MSNIEILDVIDLENRVIGQASKEEAYRNKISHRIVHILVCTEESVFGSAGQ